ncbi:MAG: DUF1501 domain-containing protein [Sphingomonadales bacterium]|nr:DUF1501 domain-containing protein [Sphingomonadales bacterium]MBD3773978.1 DUF1501 domain-containing protein [Paracoccaceae bacterium]
MIQRRSLLVGAASFGAASLISPVIAHAAAETDQRLLFVIQRGAADGLALLAPVGDPHLTALREPLLKGYDAAPRIGSFFALHPALGQVNAMAQSGEALFAHGVASAYRDRSHFDGQNLLETGGLRAYERRDGWLNRLLGLLPTGETRGLALSTTVPQALQGPRPVGSYAPSALPDADGALIDRVSALYAGDPQLSSLWQEALQTRGMAGNVTLKNLRNAQQTGALAASLMQGPKGARVMMVESEGWDSHANQPGQLGRTVAALDALLGAVRSGLGADWNRTLVIVATEFGRTARVNGTGGTDHGTASAAMLLGGRVRGGRVLADWPGLAASQLYQDRDLAPTIALESVIAGAVAEHFALDPAHTLATLFPERKIAPREGLLRV